jgi:hypothetical protein
MWNLDEYLSDLVVAQDDDEIKLAQDHVNLTQLICEDVWLARQAHYGVAGAMERQLEYIGSTLLPRTENNITRMSSSGVSNESHGIMNSWFGTTNEDNIHDNDEVSNDDRVADSKAFKEQLKVRMRTAAILFAAHVRAHDSLSKQLDQLTYSGIKAKANSNRRMSATQLLAKAV